MKYALLFVFALLTGCAQLGPTAEQIKSMEGTSSSFCVKGGDFKGVPFEVHYASYGGKSTGTAGGGGKATCGSSVAEFSNEGKAKPAEVTK